MPRKSGLDSSNSNFGLTEDSNTCELNCCNISDIHHYQSDIEIKTKCLNILGFSTVSDSQGLTDFSAHLGFSEDSNSQNSEPTSKRLKTD